MTEKNGVTTTRRPYRKPQLEQVQLVAEEAVLAGCKTVNRTQPGYENCHFRNEFCLRPGT